MKRITDIILTAFLTTLFILLYLLLFSEARYRLRANMVENYNEYVSKLRFRNGMERLQDESGKKFGPKADYFFPANQDDTLVVFKLNNKYGYMNVVTKQVQIDARFQFAYRFDHESGLAAIIEDGKIGFIDSRNNTFKIEPLYLYRKKIDNDYDPEVKFNNGFCRIPSEDGRKFGLINESNEIKLPIIYDFIGDLEQGYRIIILNGKYGLLDSAFASVLNPIFEEISINKLGIVVLDTLNSQQLLDFDCKTVISKNVFDEFSTISAEVNCDEESSSDFIQAQTNYSTFTINGNVGIISKLDGKVIIQANCFDNIEYFGKGIYKAQLDEKYFLLDLKGNFIH